MAARQSTQPLANVVPSKLAQRLANAERLRATCLIRRFPAPMPVNGDRIEVREVAAMKKPMSLTDSAFAIRRNEPAWPSTCAVCPASAHDHWRICGRALVLCAEGML